MDKKDLSKLSGDELFYYFTKEHDDEDYSSIVELIPQATAWDYEKTYTILKRVVRENKTFVAFYPEFDDIDTSNMELVGGILDGCLYISDDHYFKD